MQRVCVYVRCFSSIYFARDKREEKYVLYQYQRIDSNASRYSFGCSYVCMINLFKNIHKEEEKYYIIRVFAWDVYLTSIIRVFFSLVFLFLFAVQLYLIFVNDSAAVVVVVVEQQHTTFIWLKHIKHNTTIWPGEKQKQPVGPYLPIYPHRISIADSNIIRRYSILLQGYYIALEMWKAANDIHITFSNGFQFCV